MSRRRVKIRSYPFSPLNPFSNQCRSTPKALKCGARNRSARRVRRGEINHEQRNCEKIVAELQKNTPPKVVFKTFTIFQTRFGTPSDTPPDQST